MSIAVMLDEPRPKPSDTPEVGMPTPLEVDQRACPVSVGSAPCAVAKTVYGGCYAGNALIGEALMALPTVTNAFSNSFRRHGFFGTLQKIPTKAGAIFSAMARGIAKDGRGGFEKLSDGKIADGTFDIAHGVGTLLGAAVGVKGIGSLAMKGARVMVRVAPKVCGAYANGVNQLLSRRPMAYSADPFDFAVRNNPEFGGVHFGGTSLYAKIGALIVKQLQRLGDVKDGMFPAHENPAILVREIEVMQEEFGFKRYHFYVRINFESVGPTFELSIGRLHFRTIDAPIGNAIGADAVSMCRAKPPTVTYEQLGLTAYQLEKLPTAEALGLVHSLVPEMSFMLEKLERLALPADVN